MLLRVFRTRTVPPPFYLIPCNEHAVKVDSNLFTVDRWPSTQRRFINFRGSNRRRYVTRSVIYDMDGVILDGTVNRLVSYAEAGTLQSPREPTAINRNQPHLFILHRRVKCSWPASNYNTEPTTNLSINDSTLRSYDRCFRCFPSASAFLIDAPFHYSYSNLLYEPVSLAIRYRTRPANCRKETIASE